MEKESLLSEKILQIQHDLNLWATEHGVTKESERLVVVIRTQSSDDICRMSPEDFFSISRLMASGLNHGLAVRGNNCVRNSNRNWIWADGAVVREEVYDKTMEEFLLRYRDVKKLFRLKNLGERTIAGMVKAIRDAGLIIEDDRKMLK